mgnify:CR=1 FL=1
MIKTNKSKLHLLLLLGILVLAFSFRLIRLGAVPLFNSEAEVALEALSVARRSPYNVGPYPAVVGLTGFDFFIFRPGNFLARFWGAIFSGLIVVLPFLFRERIGLWGATIASIILAISPEMVGPARLIGTPLMALACLLLGLGFFYQRKPILTGIFFALGLMSGPGFWFGGIVLVLSFLVADWLFDASQVFVPAEVERNGRFWLFFSISFGLVLLVVGTGFFLAPQGISGIFSGLMEFVRGIFQPSSASVRIRLLALIAYAPGALILGLWGGIRGLNLRNKLDLFLLVWAGFGLLFFLVYPGGSPSYLVWVTLPLWLLAARAFAFTWRFPEESKLIVIGTALLVIVVSAFMLLALRSLIRPGLDQAQQVNTFIALLGGLILLVAVVLLVNFGWGEDIAFGGLLSGAAVIVLAGMLAVSVNSTSLTTERSYELWLPQDQSITTKWIRTSIERVLDWNAVREEPLEIAVADYDVPAMVWALSEYDPVDFVPYLPPQTRPGILITDLQAIPEISSSYRGQDLVWSRDLLWNEMSAFQFLDWLITRSAPTRENKIILWVRTDLMPDEQFSP